MLILRYRRCAKYYYHLPIYTFLRLMPTFDAISSTFFASCAVGFCLVKRLGSVAFHITQRHLLRCQGP
jgi:hypothetical protein